MEPKDTLCATGHSVEISIPIIGCLCYIAIKLPFEVWICLLFCATCSLAYHRTRSWATYFGEYKISWIMKNFQVCEN